MGREGGWEVLRVGAEDAEVFREVGRDLGGGRGLKVKSVVGW